VSLATSAVTTRRRLSWLRIIERGRGQGVMGEAIDLARQAVSSLEPGERPGPARPADDATWIGLFGEPHKSTWWGYRNIELEQTSISDWGQHLWARGHWVALSGNVTDEVWKEHIKNQQPPEPDDDFHVV
jgi:hypothetical protein